MTVPAWQRRTNGETRLAVGLAIVAAILLQAFLPDRLTLRPSWLLPGLEGVLLIAVTFFYPLRMDRPHLIGRLASIGLTAVITAGNATSAALLIVAILDGGGTNDPSVLLGSGASIYVTNIVAFALWYWELDSGGPVLRAEAVKPHPDFLFPQMTAPGLADPNWEPQFVDYLYVSFTNATAFSPTDTMPLARWAKMMMAVQSAIALAAVALVVARAVNILGG
jgi:hypothetical protein